MSRFQFEGKTDVSSQVRRVKALSKLKLVGGRGAFNFEVQKELTSSLHITGKFLFCLIFFKVRKKPDGILCSNLGLYLGTRAITAFLVKG